MSRIKNLSTLGLLLALAACTSPKHASAPISSPSPTPSVASSFSVFVTLDLNAPDLSANDGDPCEGKDGYDDIQAGTQVRISDASGKVVALGELDPGSRSDWETCEFTSQIDVPASPQGVYGVEVSHRGVVNFQPKEYVTTSVDLTLG